MAETTQDRYQNYVRYCERIGVQPQQIELWESGIDKALNAYGLKDKGVREQFSNSTK